MLSTTKLRSFWCKPELCTAILCAFCVGMAYADDNEPQITVYKPGTGSAHLNESTPKITLSPPDIRRPPQTQTQTGQTTDGYRHPLNTRQRYPQPGYGGTQPYNSGNSSDFGLPPSPSNAPDAALPPQPPLPETQNGRRSVPPEKRSQQAVPADSRKPAATMASRSITQKKPLPSTKTAPVVVIPAIPDKAPERNMANNASAPGTTQTPTEIIQPLNETIRPQKTEIRTPPVSQASVKAETPTSVEKPSSVFVWIGALILSFVLGAASLFGITTFLKHGTPKGRKKISPKTQKLLEGIFEWKE